MILIWLKAIIGILVSFLIFFFFVKEKKKKEIVYLSKEFIMADL